MTKTTFLTLYLAALAMAQLSTTVLPATTTRTGPVTVFSVMVPAASPIPSEASIIAVGPDAITFGIDVGCLPNIVNGRCEEVEGIDSITVIQGPKTHSQRVSLSGAVADAACSLDGTTLAACTVKLQSGEIKATVVSTLSGSEVETLFAPITATAGIEKLTGGQPKNTGSPPNAGPRATGNANWAIGGAAVALAMAAAL
ncbi:hypothetical protein EMCG_09651 [[Emmonsia] crescens]|uniref:Uncharacterized protein n=1 Tax=[Emmonsia] crescens TaxID=73230 RepID=A0A0G2I2H6_9EURO|nr:hypothetical protein EMCG_09651 [Emmonsia crescens UAMH 3008]